MEELRNKKRNKKIIWLIRLERDQESRKGENRGVNKKKREKNRGVNKKKREENRGVKRKIEELRRKCRGKEENRGVK